MDDQIALLKKEFHDVFREKPGCNSDIIHEIKTFPNAKPIKVAPYKLTPAKRESLVSQIDEMLRDGIIIPSKSNWCGSPVMIPKADGSHRMAIDYKALNAVTEPDWYTLPTGEQLLSSLHGATVFSTIDLKSGFWQTKIAEEDGICSGRTWFVPIHSSPIWTS